MESCGAGGRETLFQTGPAAFILPKVCYIFHYYYELRTDMICNYFSLVQIYAKSVPYPHGTVIGEELFQSGVLPSDTDFRIFRDYGHLKGIL